MSEPRTGSRYELLLARKGVAESKAARDYYAIYPADEEEGKEDEDDLVGYVHSYEVGSTVDGPGLRFVAFLTGCLLRCQFCHNPDTWHMHNGHPVTVSRAMKQIAKYAKVLKISKGGVTLSGGEPMVQKPFTTRIFSTPSMMKPDHTTSSHCTAMNRSHSGRRRSAALAANDTP